MNLELMAMRWLWLEKNCHYVIRERAPRYLIGQPDVLGVTKSRHLIEIEIKRSASDFFTDFKKPHRANREILITKMPRQFYYLMPKQLAEKIKDNVPEWAGLMQNSVNEITLEVVKVAPVNERSERLSIRECVVMARKMVSHMMSEAYALDHNKSNFINRDTTAWVDWGNVDAGLYEI